MVIVEKIVWKRGVKCPCIICLEYTSSARCGNEMENISCNFPYIHNGSDNKNPTEGNKLKCWTTFSWNTCDCEWNRKLLVWFGTRHQSFFLVLIRFFLFLLLYFAIIKTIFRLGFGVDVRFALVRISCVQYIRFHQNEHKRRETIPNRAAKCTCTVPFQVSDTYCATKWMRK